MSKRSSRARRRARRERLAAKRPATRYLECPCCGHHDCVPQGEDDPDNPGRATWWDSQRVTCAECGCTVGVDVTDDYSDDRVASARIVGEAPCRYEAKIEARLRGAALDFLSGMGDPIGRAPGGEA